MNNPWKLTTIAIGLVAATALTAGLTTAYIMRGAEPVSAAPGSAENATAETRVTAPRLAPVPSRSTITARREAVPAPPAAPPAPTMVAGRPTPVSAAAPDCATTSDRVWRIAKPGLLGAVLGAGVGAAGGAIADGGKAAGKGAAIGAIVGTTAGAAYGAYRTKNECGTILGGGSMASATPAASGADVPAQAAFAPSSGTVHATTRARATEDQITIYSAR